MDIFGRRMYFSYRISYTLFLWSVALFLSVHGGWDDPPFELLEDGVKGISIEGNSIHIIENSGHGEIFSVVKLRLTEQHTVTFETPPTDDLFALTNKDGEWYFDANTDKSFDFEALPDPSFYISLILENGVTRDFLIHIEDENDNDPTVEKLEPETIPPIPEEKAPENPILTITAADKDVDDNHELNCEVEEIGGDDSSFSVSFSGQECILTLDKPLNYSVRTSHRLWIKISDPRGRFTYHNATVIVEDVANMPPEFTTLPTIRNLTEHTPVDTRVTQARARDGDYGLNWNIVFEITNDAWNWFRIDETTGEIYVADEIDAEDERLKGELSYSFTVVAKEVVQGEISLPPELTEATYDVTFPIVDINDQQPRICTNLGQDPKLCEAEVNYSFEIYENHSSQIPLDGNTIIRVVDLDASSSYNRFNVSFASGTEKFIENAFTFSPKTGMHKDEIVILVNDQRAIDFESENWHGVDGPKEHSFTIEFTGTNDTSHRAKAHFKVIVKDINDNSPSFAPPNGNEFQFYVCENTEDGTVLTKIEPDKDNPSLCTTPSNDNLSIFAEDIDISPEFGQPSVEYVWSGTRKPPVTLDSTTGEMTMSLADSTGFDYERNKEEVFIVEAYDTKGGEGKRSSSISVKFMILDKNDEPVDLQFQSGTRATIEENTTRVDPVLSKIIARDVDLTAAIDVTMEVNDIFTKVDSPTLNGGIIAPTYKRIQIEDGLKEKMKHWFDLKPVGAGNTSFQEFNIVLGTEIPDREGYYEQEVDRVDLTITAKDNNAENIDSQTVSQVVTITLEDINDNSPEWLEDEDGTFSVSLFEVEWDDDKEDESSDRSRELYTLRVTDRDLKTTFNFSLSNEDCKFEGENCTEILEMFEISPISSTTGTTTLRRAKGAKVDREHREYFAENSDILYITIAVSDGNCTHTLLSKVEVTVEDVNDNTPQFAEDYTLKEYELAEDTPINDPVLQILATDLDHPAKFGNVSYVLIDGENTVGVEKFSIGVQNGTILTNATYDWFDASTFRLDVRAVDNYREASPSGSNANTTTVRIIVIDKNNHAPEFKDAGGSPDDPAYDAKESDEYAGFTIQVQDKDNPELDNGKITVEIDKVTMDRLPDDDPKLKDLFGLVVTDSGENNVKNVTIEATKSMIGLWGNYSITIKAMDGKDSVPRQKDNDNIYYLRVYNENLNPPVFEYPKANDTTIRVSIATAEPDKDIIDLVTGEAMPYIYATDEDKGSGGAGVVTYTMQSQIGSPPDCNDLLDIDIESGMITLTRLLVDEKDTNKKCTMIITAADDGGSQGEKPKSASAIIMFVFLWDQNTPPEFAKDYRPVVSIRENCTDTTDPDCRPTFKPDATDKDIENDHWMFGDDIIYYLLKGGDSSLFILDASTENNVTTLQLTASETLDYEKITDYQVSLYITNDPEEPVPDKDPEEILKGDYTQWTVIQVNLIDIIDTAPVFTGISKDFLTSGFTANKRADTIIGSIAVDDNDKDSNDEVTINITSSFRISDGNLPNDPNNPPFELVKAENFNNHAAVMNITLKFDPQPYFKGYYSFQVTATDKGNFTAVAECRIYVVATNNVLKFYFKNDLSYLADNQETLSAILSEAFGYSCNVDRVFNDAAVNEARTVETYFINTDSNEPVVADMIKAQQFRPEFYANLTRMLAEENFDLYKIGESDQIEDTDINQIITYVLVGGVAVLTVILLMLAATCYYNNRSLSRRVRALTASHFGADQTEVNHVGASTDAPNTNAFAVEGSNPIWTVDADGRKIEFDTESIGSGGSVLIGAEDEDYFQKNSVAPMFLAEDVVANYASDNDADEPRNYDDYGSPAQNENDSSPFSSKLTKNPLMNLGEARMSIDVDDFGGDPYQFEGNTDANLF